MEKGKSESTWNMSVQLDRPYEIPDTHRVVNSVKLSVVHGEGKMSGKSWVRLNWGNEGLYPTNALGFGFDGTKLVSLTGEEIQDNEIVKQIQDRLDKNPDLLSQLNEELSK